MNITKEDLLDNHMTFCLGAIVVLGTCKFLIHLLYEGFVSRAHIKALRCRGIPIAEPYSVITGHLSLLNSIRKKFPPDAHHAYIQIHLARHWREYFPLEVQCPPVIYLDLWPLSPSLVIVNDAKLCAQAVQYCSLPRALQSKDIVSPLTGGRDLGSSGTDIRHHTLLRARFATAFKHQNVAKNIPNVIEEAGIFTENLRKCCGVDEKQWGGVFSLENKVSEFVFDILANFTVGLSLNEQMHGHSDLRLAIYRQTTNLLPRTLFTLQRRLNPFYQLSVWKINRAIDCMLAPIIHSRFHDKPKMNGGIEKRQVERTVLDIVAEEYQRNKKDFLPEDKKELVDSVLQNVKIFILAGHDTTTATICYTLEMLARHPAELEDLRAEHDLIFGKDPRKFVDILRKSPEKLSNLPFTLAVIKECLRLFPLAVTMRQGSSSFAFNYGGILWPTQGFNIQTGGWTIHCNPHYWQRADEFIPRRWLSGKNDSLHPINNAWRPFEHGPMNCIGQGFATMAIKIALIMVVREFDFECAWKEWDARKINAGLYDMVNNDRLYRTEFVSGVFKDRMPVHARLRKMKA